MFQKLFIIHPRVKLRGVIWLIGLRDTGSTDVPRMIPRSTRQRLVRQRAGTGVHRWIWRRGLPSFQHTFRQRELRGTVVDVVEPLIGQHETSFTTQFPHTTMREYGLRTSGEETGSM